MTDPTGMKLSEESNTVAELKLVSCSLLHLGAFFPLKVYESWILFVYLFVCKLVVLTLDGGID